MKSDDAQSRDSDLLKRYRAASDSASPAPSEGTRSVILAEARRLAESHSHSETSQPFDTRQPAANQSRWRVAAFGTVGVALFAAILMVPAWRQQSGSPAELAAEPVAARPSTELDSPSLGQDRPVPPVVEAEADRRGARQAAAAPARKREAVAPPAEAEPPRQAYDQEAAPERSNAAADAVTRAPAPMARIAPAAPPAYALGTQAARAPTRAAPAAVLLAVQQGDLQRLTGLLAAGAATAESDDAGRSPLLVAVLAKRADLVRALLAHGANPNAADPSGLTPLRAALDGNAGDITTALRQSGAQEP